MKAFMTVVLKNRQSYSAQNLQILRKGWGADYEQEVLVFECSGVLTVFNVEDVASIDYGAPVTPEAAKLSAVS